MNQIELTVEDKIQTLISRARRSLMFESPDKHSVASFRSHISKGLSQMKTVGLINGYRIHVIMTPNGHIIGDITYTPIPIVKDIKIDFTVSNSTSIPEQKFDKAMKGI